MKTLLSILLIILLLSSKNTLDAQQNDVNPTGTYELISKNSIHGGHKYGRWGTLQVVEMREDKIAINLQVCTGAPAYNSGALQDSIEYKNNRGISSIFELDSVCKITFVFYANRVVVTASNFGFYCGFGHGVYCDGIYKKNSSEIPEFRELY